MRRKCSKNTQGKGKGVRAGTGEQEVAGGAHEKRNTVPGRANTTCGTNQLQSRRPVSIYPLQSAF